MPVALWIMGLGFVKLIYDVSRYNFHVTTSTVLAILVGFQIAVLALIGDLVARSRGSN
jgi:ABC-type methionine transport system permease subunit